MIFSTEQLHLKVNDYSVSQETFSLLYNQDYDLLKTHPSPRLDQLGRYYESEDYISHTDSKKTILDKMYHLVKKFSLKKKVGLVNNYLDKGNLLDIGSGTGDFLVHAQKKSNWKASGFEPSQRARQISLKKGVQLLDDLNSIPDDSFDVITMWHVLEHVPDLVEHIKLLKRISKPNGIIIIAVPNYKSYDAEFYKNFWAAYDVPRHLWHFSKKSIEKLFGEQQMKLLHVKPMWFDSFYVSILSEKYKKGRINYISAFFIGFYSNFKGFFSKEVSSHIYVIKNS